jgi:uncharacterized protein YjbI with pentapeptide repeats
MLKDFDLSQFISSEEMHIENANIENCKISGIKNKFCVISKCNFNNVVFENSFYEVYAMFKECEFRECTFRDTFEGDDLELAVHDDIFINCEFQNISYSSSQVQSDVTNCKFINCNFSNIKIEGDLCFVGLELQSGKIDSFSFYGNEIMQNNFSDLQIKDMNLNCAFMKNKMERICFKRTKISGYYEDNIFIDCEPNGIEMGMVTEDLTIKK